MQVTYAADGSATVSFDNTGAGLILGRNGGVDPFGPQPADSAILCFELQSADRTWQPAIGHLIAGTDGGAPAAVSLAPPPPPPPPSPPPQKATAEPTAATAAPTAAPTVVRAGSRLAAPTTDPYDPNFRFGFVAEPTPNVDDPLSGDVDPIGGSPVFAKRRLAVKRRRLHEFGGPAAIGVRYAYADAPDGCNLYNDAQLPAVPFLSSSS